MMDLKPIVFKIFFYAAIVLAVRAVLFIMPVMLHKILNP